MQIERARESKRERERARERERERERNRERERQTDKQTHTHTQRQKQRQRQRHRKDKASSGTIVYAFLWAVPPGLVDPFFGTEQHSCRCEAMFLQSSVEARWLLTVESLACNRYALNASSARTHASQKNLVSPGWHGAQLTRMLSPKTFQKLCPDVRAQRPAHAP